MKLFRMLGRSFRDAFKSVIRNFSLSLASISCITITLIIVAIAIMASLNINNFTDEIEKDLTIVVFLDRDADDNDIKDVKRELDKISNVEKITFISKDEVKEQMREESEVFAKVLDGYDEGESPLKDTYQVKVKEIEKIKVTADRIKKIDSVSVVRYGEGMVEKLVSAFTSIKNVTYGVVIALIVVTVFLIVNTIKLTISARKREIGIMRLVGASNFTIKTPFIIEGMILGVLGSIIPIIFTTYGYMAFYKHFDGYLFSKLIVLIKPEPFIYTTSLIVIIIGILVGMIGSASAVKKYLKI
ncbi:MAG: permease-like cell division protein FtsX [Tenericutes bacterium]|nr:permease-like cell division protein FtsX [Mycoplasmatota bacterium]MDD6941823.1 permease-like cell division protein FtsX [bacterium]MDY2696829.1 permease-like cell division protein FtsX [Bacilli bacterium]